MRYFKVPGTIRRNFKPDIGTVGSRDKVEPVLVGIQRKEQACWVCCADSVSVSFNEEGTMPLLWPVSVTCSRILAPWEHEGKTSASETARCQEDWKRDVTRARAFRPTSVLTGLRNTWTYHQNKHRAWKVQKCGWQTGHDETPTRKTPEPFIEKLRLKIKNKPLITVFNNIRSHFL